MIPVNVPLYIGNEKKYLVDCIETGWLSSEGKYVKEFENNFSKYIGVKNAIAVSNGTAALETALYGLGIKSGDEVILPSFTIISCAIAIIRLGAKPVLVDIEPDTWNLNVSLIEEKITEKTKAIMPVHIYGHPVDMNPLLEIAKKYNLLVIEDTAEAHGAEYYNKKCGSFGNAAAFSFYANKIINTGEGGMVLCNSDEVADRCRAYRNLSFHPEKRFWHTEFGYNFRMTNMQAAVGLAQLEKIDEYLNIKIELGEYYHEMLKDIDEIKLQVEKPYAKLVYWMYSLQLDSKLGFTGKQMIIELRKKGIDSRSFFIGIHEQPVLNNMGLFLDEKYPVTENASKYGLYLPSGLALKKEQIDYIVKSFKEIIYDYKKGLI